MASDDAISVTPKYLIGRVTKLTGLSVDVVRVWERRYGAVRPIRSNGGTRLYSDADVHRLRRLRQAVDGGHSIGQAARLSERELDELIADTKPATHVADPYRAVRERFVEAVRTMDVIAAEQELTRAATLFPVRELVKRIIGPILEELRKRQAQKEFGVAVERFAAGLVRSMLGSLFRLYPPSPEREIIVTAAPVGERDEFGPLLAGLLAASRGWCVVCLGAAVPASEIALAIRMTNARVLVLNLANGAQGVDEELAAISRLIPVSTRVWINGAESVSRREPLTRYNWSFVRDLDELDDRLDE